MVQPMTECGYRPSLYLDETKPLYWWWIKSVCQRRDLGDYVVQMRPWTGSVKGGFPRKYVNLTKAWKPRGTGHEKTEWRANDKLAQRKIDFDFDGVLSGLEFGVEELQDRNPSLVRWADILITTINYLPPRTSPYGLSGMGS
ncbi:hypothetical protein PIIN_09789 [Serendipita indica DSM 11827]|uniref:Uncharacterized protein n=1 Tax=Serendipita indica (strain DSM 11827) TaxID=1109443 RepID=G4TWV8_SERID|nr:hypothetical protein PIIN_09789 [Serendipita indica DSM 11827]